MDLTETMVVVDVGARGKPPREFRRLHPARLVAFEPEPLEAERLGSALAAYDFEEVTVVPAALGDGAPTTLFTTANPGFTSIYRPTDALHRFVPDTDVVSEQTIETMTLDAAAEEYGFADADVIKLDTQGSELEILRHGRSVVSSAVAVATEVSFQPIYSGGALFGDLDSFLREAGLVLCDMRRGRMRAIERLDSLPSTPHTLWAHCLYLREPDGLPDRKRAALFRAAVAYGYLDTAAAIDRSPESMARLRERARTFRDGDADPGRFRWKD
jgi:FkbM family methyltransferase